jgi:LysR family transcriptional regulator, low CO2-responsive transcriptional regulator
MKRVTIKQLESVRAVAEAGTIVKAAEELNVTPAALTSRIQLLEEDAGVALFDRCGGRLRLTVAGQEVVDAAHRVERLMTDLDATLGALRGTHSGRLAVGIVSTAKYIAPRLVAAFARQNPRIDLAITVGNRAEMTGQLRDYKIDVCLMGRPPGDFPVDSVAIGAHPQVIIAATDHPLVGRVGIEKGDLAHENFIVREEGSGTRAVFDYFFSDVPVRHPKINIEIGSNETIKQAVMAGLGLALLSAHTIEAEMAAQRLAILDVVGLPLLRQWFIVRRSDRAPTPIAQAIWDFAVAEAPKLLPKTLVPEFVSE